MRTPVYINEQLLLSEGMCRQLGIVTNHPEVQTWRGGCKQLRSPTAKEQPGKQATVPTARVGLVKSFPGKSTVVEVQTQHYPSKQPLLMECARAKEALSLQSRPSEEGRAGLVISNPSSYTQEVVPAMIVGLLTKQVQRASTLRGCTAPPKRLM